MMYRSVYPALMDLKNDCLPIFIPTFNQPTFLKMTIDQLDRIGFDGVIVIYDNNSTYPEMIELLETVSNEHLVIRSGSNLGPRFFTEDIEIMKLLPKQYIVSDPDLIYNECLPKNFVEEMSLTIKEFHLAKVGFALEIYDQSETDKFIDTSSVHDWEEGYWKEKIGQTRSKNIIYRAWIDSTFALNDRDSCMYYRKFNQPTFRYPSARIADSYTARHMGWWKKELQPQGSDEINYYLNTQKWSHTENYYYRGIT